ncbi:MAG: GNAT family N-acetyltransferase [Gammaproteobacteria bacterium]|nr:GNAT family N-acetyltransferase [Gammaproteobacteria bacterium]
MEYSDIHRDEGARVLAPDGLSVLELAGADRVSTALFSLPAGAIGRAIKHRTVMEIWYVLAGHGELWRRSGERHSVVPLTPGLSLCIAPDTCFQVRAAPASLLEVLGATAPAWPGDEEVRLVAGRWPLKPLWAAPYGELRQAVPAEGDALFDLAMSAKAYWGYPESFLEQCAGALRPKFREGEYLSVMADSQRLYGFACLSPVDGAGTVELEALFIEPRCIGAGLGAELLEDVSRAGRARGASRLRIAADPQAAGFYERCGAQRLGECPSDAIPGRMLPLLELKL